MPRAQNGVFWKIQAHTSPHIYLRARRRAGGAAGKTPPRGQGRARTLLGVCDPSWAEGLPGHSGGPPRRGADGAGPISGRADEEAPGGVANRVVLWCKGGCTEINDGQPRADPCSPLPMASRISSTCSRFASHKGRASRTTLERIRSRSPASVTTST